MIGVPEGGMIFVVTAPLTFRRRYGIVTDGVERVRYGAEVDWRGVASIQDATLQRIECRLH